jgi:hypothetical protein
MTRAEVTTKIIKIYWNLHGHHDALTSKLVIVERHLLLLLLLTLRTLTLVTVINVLTLFITRKYKYQEGDE